MWAEKWAADKAAAIAAYSGAADKAAAVYSARYGIKHSKPQWLRQSVQCPTARHHLDNMPSAAQSRMAELSWEQHHWVGPDIDIPVPDKEQPSAELVRSSQQDAGCSASVMPSVLHQLNVNCNAARPEQHRQVKADKWLQLVQGILQHCKLARRWEAKHELEGMVEKAAAAESRRRAQQDYMQGRKLQHVVDKAHPKKR